MDKILKNQKDYIKAYEVLNETTNVAGLLMLTEMSYETKKELALYKDSKFRSEEYYSKIDTCYKHLISTFFKIDNANNIYDNFRDIYHKKYLDNTEDDTNDYKDETMFKINKIFNFINNLGDQDLKGSELLSLIKNEISDDAFVEDTYFDIQFEKLKAQSDEIRVASIDKKIEMINIFLDNVGEMEAHLFRRKLFEDDYRKSVTGLVNYLFSRAGIPEIYIKPIELEEYYSCVSKKDFLDNNNEIIIFYKEKICDSIEDLLIIPMKDLIKNYLDEEIRKETGELDNKIVSLRQNKYK